MQNQNQVWHRSPTTSLATFSSPEGLPRVEWNSTSRRDCHSRKIAQHLKVPNKLILEHSHECSTSRLTLVAVYLLSYLKVEGVTSETSRHQNNAGSRLEKPWNSGIRTGKAKNALQHLVGISQWEMDFLSVSGVPIRKHSLGIFGSVPLSTWHLRNLNETPSSSNDTKYIPTLCYYVIRKLFIFSWTFKTLMWICETLSYVSLRTLCWIVLYPSRQALHLCFMLLLIN